MYFFVISKGQSIADGDRREKKIWAEGWSFNANVDLIVMPFTSFFFITPVFPPPLVFQGPLFFSAWTINEMKLFDSSLCV